MSELDDLLAACRANPDDDAPRLVWADAVGGERGELVVLQCRLAREELPPAEMGALIHRHDELLANHGAAWAGFARNAGVTSCVFRRGFVEAVELDVVKIPWSTLFARMPLVQSVHLAGITRRIAYHEDGTPEGPEPVPYFAALLDAPALQRLRGLELDSMYLHESDGDTEWDFHITSYGDDALALVGATSKLDGFRTLAVRDQYTPRGMQALMKANVLATVERLAIEWGETDRGQLEALVAAAPNLRALAVATGFRAIEGALPSTLVELSLGSQTPEDLAALAASPVAARLERLAVGTTKLASIGGLFDAFPRLRALDLQYTTPGANEVAETNDAFTRAKLPALRELRPFHELTDAQAIAIADAFGAQLACFDVLGQDQLTCRGALLPRIAGRLRFGGYQNPAAPLTVGINTREPWLRYGVVRLGH